MPTVAEQLRQGRANRNLSVYDVADATKIRTDHVRALEEGNYGVFAAPVYLRGFVRSYSTLLKLDTEAVLRQLETEIGKPDLETGMLSQAPPHRGATDKVMLQVSKIPVFWLAAFAGLAVVAIVGFAGYRIWANYQSQDPVAGLGPELYNPPRTNQGEYLALPQPPTGR